MEVIAKIYDQLDLNTTLMEMNESFLEVLSRTNEIAHSMYGREVHQIISRFTESEIGQLKALPISLVVINNKEFAKGIANGFRPSEINHHMTYRMEVLNTLQRMSSNSAAMEFAFDANITTYRSVTKLTSSGIKKASQYQNEFFQLRRGFNEKRWENVRRVFEKNEGEQKDITEELLVCLL